MISIQNKPSGIVLSSEFTELVISTNQKQVFVTVQNQSYDYIFHESMWVNGSSLTIFDLASLIEADMKQKDWVMARYTVTIYNGSDTDSCSVSVLYCESFSTAGVDPDKFTSEYFLTTATEKRISPEFSFPVYLYSKNSSPESFEVKCFYRYKNSPNILSFTSRGYCSGGANIYRVDLSTKIIMQWMLSARIPTNDLEIISLSIDCGGRYMSFFVDNALHNGQTFFFKNIFNAWDFVTLPALTSKKTDVERSLANIGSKSIFYDKEVSKSYEVQSGPITVDEAELISQLVASHDVYRISNDTIFPILITDSDSPVNDGDELQSVKFIWRYADNRPNIALPSDLKRIFTSEYNKVFS